MPHLPAPPSATPIPPPQVWDIFCQVIDNFGDIGVCWRLAADLARRGCQVRLWVDDGSALAWMAPQGAPGVTVHPWPGAVPASGIADVVVEAFG
ncbi:elongation factor P maturation arginine rhamnosyltransferase EarP, partial [Comamonas sp.]